MNQTDPRQPLLSEKVLGRREVFRVVEATGSNVNFFRSRVPFESKGSAAHVAKSPPRAGVRTESSWSSHFNFKVGATHRDPRD